jgi:hypothetical protein
MQKKIKEKKYILIKLILKLMKRYLDLKMLKKIAQLLKE